MTDGRRVMKGDWFRTGYTVRLRRDPKIRHIEEGKTCMIRILKALCHLFGIFSNVYSNIITGARIALDVNKLGTG